MSVAFCLSFTERRQSWRRSSLEAINSGGESRLLLGACGYGLALGAHDHSDAKGTG